MKILLLNDMATPAGGAELMTLTLREELQARGHDARIFASTALSSAAVSFADYTCFGTTSQLRTLNRVINLSAYWQLSRVLKRFRPDVVHVRMFLTQLSPTILPLLRQVPSLYHAVWYESICPTGLKLLPDGSICQEKAGVACYRNGCLSPQAWGPLMLQLKLWRMWRNVFNLIVANSEAVRRLLVENGIEPVEVVHNGVPIRPTRPTLSSPPAVSYASRLSWEKGPEVLLRAFAKVVMQIPAARLLVAGDGPEREPLNRLIANLNLDANVSMLGHLSQSEMERQLAPAWVQVVPSRLAEPFGLAAAEGMMRGTAVVATNAGGLTEIVQDGRTGLLVPPSNVDALAEALLHLLRNRGLAEEMGRAGRERAMAHFSHKTCIDKFISCIDHLAKR